MVSKVKIGITMDFKERAGYSNSPYFAIRKNHFDSLNKHGCLPIALHYNHDLIDDYLKMIDGLVLIGGHADIDPKRYGQELHKTVKLNKPKEDFEFALAKKAFEIKPDMPILGICGGAQVLNVLFGGSLVQDIISMKKGALDHEQSNAAMGVDYSFAYHRIDIKEGSFLAKIAGKTTINTNSSHHQAVDRLADGFEVSALSEDKIIEAIEKKDHRFCLGLQWHPEFESSDADEKIFAAFVKYCQKS